MKHCRLCKQPSEVVWQKSCQGFYCLSCIPEALRRKNEWRTRYYQKNKSIRSAGRKEYYQTHKEKLIARVMLYKRSNPDKVRVWNRNSRARHLDKCLAKSRAYYQKNRTACLTATRNWTKTHREHDAAYKRAYMKRRKEEDLAFKMQQIIRCRIYCALNRGKGRKSSRTIELLGCTSAHLISYLESQFVEGMSWETYGPTGWHVDHILPCSAFDLSNPEHQKACFHFTNLQPMWARENFLKSNKVTLGQLTELMK